MLAPSWRRPTPPRASPGLPGRGRRATAGRARTQRRPRGRTLRRGGSGALDDRTIGRLSCNEQHAITRRNQRDEQVLQRAASRVVGHDPDSDALAGAQSIDDQPFSRQRIGCAHTRSSQPVARLRPPIRSVRPGELGIDHETESLVCLHAGLDGREGCVDPFRFDAHVREAPVRCREVRAVAGEQRDDRVEIVRPFDAQAAVVGPGRGCHQRISISWATATRS